ncbi:MAG: hypothetical protein LH603_15190, partial [Pseudonocardia sp.]|nr:hypothetical protein [Pseudonocardia sp.]
AGRGWSADRASLGARVALVLVALVLVAVAGRAAVCTRRVGGRGVRRREVCVCAVRAVGSDSTPGGLLTSSPTVAIVPHRPPRMPQVAP